MFFASPDEWTSEPVVALTDGRLGLRLVYVGGTPQAHAAVDVPTGLWFALASTEGTDDVSRSTRRLTITLTDLPRSARVRKPKSLPSD